MRLLQVDSLAASSALGSPAACRPSYYEDTLARQNLSGVPGAYSPYENLTFGGLLMSPQAGVHVQTATPPAGVAISTVALISPPHVGTARQFTLYVHGSQTPTLAGWEEELATVAEQDAHRSAASQETGWAAHCAHWTDVWTRANVAMTPRAGAMSPNSLLAANMSSLWSHVRFLHAIQGRNYPIKFNGLLFTVNATGKGTLPGTSPDFRQWGGGFWHQNTRLPYASMSACGDAAFQAPWYEWYLAILGIRVTHTQRLYNVTGAFFEETRYECAI